MRSWKFFLPLLATSLCFAAQPDRITSPIDSSQLVALKGNVTGLIHPGSDLGRTDSAQILHGVTLVFHPSAAQQADLNSLLVQQQQRSSPNYHKWLTPAQFADRFGMTQADIARVTTWLESQGFTVTTVANSRNQISFDGTVAQVETIFATQIHNYLVDGAIYFANATNPFIPTALAPSVAAMGHLHNFSPKPRAIFRKFSSSTADPHFTSAISGNHFVTPGDFATIYDVQALYTAGFTGTNQIIAIIGQSTVSATDLANFRNAAGLTAKVPQYILYPSNSTPTRCTGDEGESDLDLEWSNGVASNATVKFVYAGLVAGDSCGQNRTYSVWDALQQAIDNNYAPIISTSYGFCESGLGSSFVVTTLQGWAQEANAQGQTIMAASGDAGAADCDATDAASATGGIAVDAPASLPEVTGMGGTEFNADNPNGDTTVTNGNAAPDLPYWNGTTGGVDAISSALEYIPGTAWNDTVENDGLLAAGGGASIFFSKPTWQTGTGVPADSKRDVPDLALNTSPAHDPYLFCSEDGPNNTIVATCTSGFRTGSGGNLTAVGGTSAAAPTFAAILTLVEQDLGSTGLGNINPNLYYIAAGNPTALHDITTGNNIVPCTEGSLDCPSTSPFQYGFSAGTGYDQVTGLGSVDANMLATAWSDLSTTTTTAVSANPTSIFQGGSVVLTATVTPATATGMVNFYNNGSTTLLGSAPLSSGTAALTTTSLPAGTNSITGTYVGINASSTSSAVAVTVSAPFSMSASPSTITVSAGQSAIYTITVTPLNGSSSTVNFTNSASSSTSTTPGSCTAGLPSGALCTFTPPSVTLDGVHSQNVTLTVSTAPNMAPGSQSITVTGTSGTTSVPTSINLTETATTESFTIAPTGNTQTYSVVAGGTAAISFNVASSTGFINTSSSTTVVPLNYTCTGLPSESTGIFNPGNLPCSGAINISATAVTLNIATTAPTAQMRAPLAHRTLFYALLLPGMFGIVFAGVSRTRGARLLGLIVVLSVSTLGLGSCGGGSSSSSQKNPGTPAGTYPIMVNATTNAPTGGTALTNTFTVNLVVTN
jgi:subtilase family serine protease